VRESAYEAFLSDDSAITSKDKAVKSRMSKARSIENHLNVNLDVVVNNDRLMYQTLLRIQKELNDHNGATQNALRKYYIFVNGKKFPAVKTYEKLCK
jgi:hypothetical protein